MQRSVTTSTSSSVTYTTRLVRCWTSTSVGPLSLNRRHLCCADCLEDKGEDYQNCSVLYCVPQLYSYNHTQMSSSYRCTSY